MPRTAHAAPAAAGIRARAGGYVVDMVIFAAIAMIVVVFAGFLLLAMTDWAKQDPSDPQFYTFLAIIGLGTPIVWTGLNLALLATRGQTGGQYVAGLRLVREDGSRLSPREAAAWWLCFNPLLFSWPMAGVAGLPLAAVIALILSQLTIVVFGVVMIICVASPIIAVVSALMDGQHRALHDRIAGTVAVPAG
ncbi:MAG: RDD family protein [Chloroflexota bacterium]